ncbi:MAG: hypothetical protein EOP68_19855 [Sphingomonas sp.]|jgi:hypothetical protein|nr:MAG: hypothetical protein EOP68_19855 [Sphingomonas sp.]
MIEHDDDGGRVVPFVRRWHVIHDIDLARLIADHARLRDVCDRLEACADALPDGVSDADADAVSRRLRAVVVSHPRDETAVIDALFAADLDDPLTATLVGRIRARHLSNAVEAEDILAALAGASTPCAEAFGHMLRGFFDGCRRAMEFTELAILTLGAQRLTPDARALLVGGLCGRAAA